MKILNLLITTIFVFLISHVIYAKTSQQEIPTVVNTVQVQQQDFQNSIQATGSLFSLEGITIKPEIEGKVVKIYFRSGQLVKKNDKLIELDSAITRAQLKKANSQLLVSKNNYERYYQLFLKKFYDKADLEKAKATFDSNEADVEELKAKLDKTIIKAPFDGKIGLRKVSIGEYVDTNSVISNLKSLDPLYVEFSVPEIYLSQINLNDKIDIKIEAFPDENFIGTIYAIDSTVDPNTRTLKARAKIPNINHKLISGLFAELTIYIGEKYKALIIPQTAVVYDQDGNFVYRLIDKKAVKTNVVLGDKLPNNQIIIKKGLTEQDTVILGGQVKLHDGASVIPKE